MEDGDANARGALETTTSARAPTSVMDIIPGVSGGLTTFGLLSNLGVDLQGPGSVVSAVAVLAAIIFVHECGHFSAARLQGIHVNKFAVGFGPSLLTYRGPEVE
jgi:hypothetical protein